MPAWVAPAIAAVGGLLGNMWNTSQQRKDYRAQQRYNSPKMQMKRYAEAGLSPYLIYGQGNPGNASTPAPSYNADVGKGIADYMGMVNFRNDLQVSKLQQDNLRAQNDILNKNAGRLEIENIKKQLELWSDYPDLSWLGDDIDKDKVVSGGFKRKINELKLSASQAMLDKLAASIEGMKSKNIVERIKAKYASEYGMVGGDWTQGLGLLKSIPSMFKGARKIPENEKHLIDAYRKFKGDQYKRDANRFLFEQLK